jgi:hypothetical protein
MATWKLGETVEDADGTDNVEEFWYAFRAWLESLPSSYTRLHALAGTAVVQDRLATGQELVAAWSAMPTEDSRVQEAVQALADAFLTRMIAWAQRHDYAPPPDPAELHLDLD